MTGISEYEREKWREVAEREMAAQLADGTLVPLDETKESHRVLGSVAREVAQENGIDPKVYILQVHGVTDEHRAAHARSTLGGFSAIQPLNAIIIPEAAAEFFTRDETAAVLNHEMDHLIREEVFYEKMRAFEQAQDSTKEAHFHRNSGSHPKRIDEAEQKRDANIAALAEVSTEAEVAADERAVSHGHASDLIGALQKIEIARNAADKVDFYPADDIINYVSAVRESRRSMNDPVKAAQHTSETFVERLQRLEKAAESEPERPSRSR